MALFGDEVIETQGRTEVVQRYPAGPWQSPAMYTQVFLGAKIRMPFPQGHAPFTRDAVFLVCVCVCGDKLTGDVGCAEQEQPISSPHPSTRPLLQHEKEEGFSAGGQPF